MNTLQIKQTLKCLDEAAMRIGAAGGPTERELEEAQDATYEALQRIIKARKAAR